MSAAAPDIPGLRGEVVTDEALAKHTSFRIGGPADLLVFPADEDDVILAVRWAAGQGLPLSVLGNGTNVLVSDRGVRGVTILTARALNDIEVSGTEVRAGCGAPLMKVAFRAARAGLSGMEFAEGIPGTLGGAIYMNAGTIQGDVKQSLADVRAVSRDGKVKTLTPEDLQFTYRASAISRTRDVLLSARFALRHSSQEEVRACMARLRDRRHETQPHASPSAGCAFKNPGDGRSAGKMLDQAGAKGWREGGAVVSDVHANFVLNDGGASAADVVALMRRMRALIREREGVVLRPEIEFVGEWDALPFSDDETGRG